MKKTRILVSLLLVAVLVTSALAVVACGNGDNRIELLLWGPSTEHTFLQEWANKWAEDYTDSKGNQYKVKLGIMDEGEAGTTVMNAPQDAADVYSFADDQLPKLVAAGGLASLGNPATGAVAKRVAEANNASSVEAATYTDGNMYAYPLSSDNAYFLYYNSTKLNENEIKKWDDIIAKAESDSTLFYSFSFGEAWYQASWFFSFGGTVSATETNFGDDAVGLRALKAAHAFSDSASFKALNPSDSLPGLNDGTIIATVAYPGLYKDITNTDVKVAALPAITFEGQEYPMYSFLGSKLLGVNGQGKYLEASHALAEYMSGEAVQAARAEKLNAGPSNLKAAASEAAQNLPTLKAIAAQAEHSVPQINLPTGFWTALPTCVDAVKVGSTSVGDYFPGGTADDDALRTLLAALVVGFDLAE
ncbi:MAG: extracellular solute-binding protein [Corallococcus sp.]|nr:extracellular solute-binding protein [Corallococcus sp.]MCM1360090.1 extracellular solute-binding protein [Corallococcus sp.]MCM1395647.1 extracellular solute-binding protein [Corallococcus sp.]